MWDRDYRRALRQASRDQRRASRQAFKTAQRGYQYNYYARGRPPFLRILFVILLSPFILKILGLSWHAFFPLIPLAIIVLVFFWLRSSLSGPSGFSSGHAHYQQPNQYYQPPPQPSQPNQYYQPSPQPNTPPYQPYGQGYQAPPQSAHQQGVPLYQSNPSQPAPQQYEEPQAQYPQEMPPMV